MKYSPASSGVETRGAVKGARNFRFMRYSASDNALYVGRGRKTDANVSAGEKLNGDTDIYLFYQRVLTVHYVDADGKELYPSSTTYTSNGSTGSYIIPYFWQDYDGYTLTSAASKSGHGEPIAIYDENVTSADKHEIKKIEWKYDDNDEKWTTRLTLNDDSMEVKDKLISDVYMVYPKNGTTAFTGVIHHVDQNGTKLKNDTSYTISTSVTDSGKGYTDQWNGYSSLAQGIFGFDSGLGDYTGAYIGSFGDKNCWTTHGVLYKYDSASSTWHTAKGTTGSEPDAKTELTDEQGSPVLYKEIWIVYQKAGTKDVIVHHVDDEGKSLHEDTAVQVSNSFVLKPDEAAAAIPGYVLKDARIGSGIAGEVFTKGSYSYTNRTWKNGFINGNTILDTDTPVNEITLVYRSLNKFTVHYIDTDGNTIKGDTSFILSNGEIKDLDGKEFTEDIVNGTDTYNHVKTCIRSDTADMNVSRVTVKALGKDETERDQTKKDQSEKGQAQKEHSVKVIYMRKADLLEPDGVMVQADAKNRHAPKNTWTASTAAGRVFTLRKAGSDYTLTDTGTDAGAGGLNLKKTETKNGAIIQTFVSSGIDNDHLISYIVTASASTDDAEHMNYRLSVDESTENSQTDIYEVFSRKQDGGRLILHNDLADSGNLIVEGDTTLKDILNNKDISNIQYTWHKVVNGTDDTVVSPNKRGSIWNIVSDSQSRTWLNVSADDGAKSKDKRSVEYYCVLSYINTPNGQTQTVTSNKMSINYLGDLENGSFESPSGNMSWSNADYKAAGGVWQTTGIGTTAASGGAGDLADIEIVSTKDFSDGSTFTGRAAGYGFAPGSDGRYSSFKAKDGTQFAELNAETAGALYQDIMTIPNVSMSYWLSHRARGLDKDTNPEYDSMYLVIMPSHIALTAAEDGGELDTQRYEAAGVEECTS